MGDKAHVFNGNIVVGSENSMGFGISPDPQVLEATGPQLLTVLGDPNGSVIAPRGSVALQRDTAALWQNQDGISTWEAIGGGSSGNLVLKQRVQLGDLPSAVNYTTTFGPVPANRPILSTLPFVTDAPAGGGVTTCELTSFADAPPGTILFDGGELVGFPSPDWWNAIRDGSAVYAPRPTAANYDVLAVDRLVSFGVTADVNLDTLTNFDVTLVVVVGPELIVP
jgi:hypothetical protein